MPQIFPDIAGTDNVRDSRVPLLNRDEALRSNFSGTAFPTSPTPVVGQTCFRTDQGILYQLVSTGPDVWRAVGSNFVQYVSTVSGSGNAITLTPPVNPPSAAAGYGFIFVAIATSTGPVTVTVPTFGTVDLRDQAGAALATGAITNGTIYYITSVSASQFRLVGSGGGGGAGSFATGAYTAVGGETTIVVSEDVAAAGALQFHRGNVRQQAGVDYTANGTTSITITDAAVAGEQFWWIHGAGTLPVGVPSDGSVTSAKLSGDLLASLATGSYTATGGETTVTVSQSVSNPGALMFAREGLQQRPGTDYTANGTAVLTLAVPAVAGEQFWWIHDGSTVFIGAPSDNTVTTVKILDGAVTFAKLATTADVQRPWRRSRQFAGQSS